jgi:hypothetical protein
MFRPLVDLIAVLDPKLAVISCSAKLTRLGAIDLGVELADAAAHMAPSSAPQILAPS